MKFLTTLALFCASIFISPIFSQGIGLSSIGLEEDKSNVSNPHQIGLSIANGLGGTLTYRYEFSKNNVLRARYNTGGLMNLVFRNSNNSLHFINFGVGFERHIPITKKLSAYFGIETGFLTVIDENRALISRTNIDVLAGLKYKVNKRISLFVEARYGIDFKGTPTEGDTFWATSWGAEFHAGILFTLGKFKNKK